MTVLIRWARRRLAVVVLTCALVTVITVLVAPSGSSSFTAEARVSVVPGASSRGPGSANDAITAALNLAGIIPNSDVVLSAVPGLSQEQVADRLNITTDGIQVIIKFSGDTPKSAQTGASDIAQVLLSGGLSSIAPARSLTRVRTASTETITESHPTSTSTHLLIGLGIGLLLGIVVAVAWDRRDRRIDEPEDLARVLDTTVTSLTTMSEWQARGLRQRWLSADPNNDGVVALVNSSSRITDPLPWLYAEFGEVAGTAGLRLTRTTDRLVKNLAAVKTLSGTTLLFAGTVGTEGAVAATLVADVTVVAVTEGTPARDVLECRRRLAQQGVVPGWALIVPRGAARAADRAEQRSVRANRPKPGDGRQVPPVSAVPAGADHQPAEPPPAKPQGRIVLEPPSLPVESTTTVEPELPAVHRAAGEQADEQQFGERTLVGSPVEETATDTPPSDGPPTAKHASGQQAPARERTDGSANGSAAEQPPAASGIDADLEQLLAAADQPPVRRANRSSTRRTRSRAR